MDRRLFVKHALTGAGLAAMPTAAVRALAQVGPATPAMAGAPVKASLAPLLARSRTALDAYPDKFLLRDRIALADFSVASSEHRFHIVDLVAGQAVSYLVAHGLGSDPDHTGYLQTFSNEPDTQATSEGAYLTGEIYDGTHGAAMRLVGLEATNSNADIRAIVLHSAAYVSEDHVARWGKAGRSNGCFVVAPHLITQVLGLLGPGRLLLAAKI